jgi:hypothetical protein
MKLTEVRYGRRRGGYRCASDPRIQFRPAAVVLHPERDTVRHVGWVVRLGNQDCPRQFKTLREAKNWARQHWRPHFVLGRFLTNETRPLLPAALLGDEAAFFAFLDRLEESGLIARDGWREQLTKGAYQHGVLKRR